MKQYIFLILISFCFSHGNAQTPNWVVNTAPYQHSMTFTAFLNVNGNTLSSTEDKVAVFVNNQIRGVANLVFVPKYNKYVAYISAYANISGEVLSFKIYDSINNTVVDVPKTENFIIDGSLGGAFQSYSIASPELSNEAELSSFSFLDVTVIKEVIEDDKIQVVLPLGTDLTNLIPDYSTSDGAVFFVNDEAQISGVSAQDFTETVVYTLLSADQSVLKTFEVSVSLGQVSVNPPVITLETNENVIVSERLISINLKSNIPLNTFDESIFLLDNMMILSIEKETDLSYNLQLVVLEQGAFSIQVPQDKLFNNNEGNITSNALSFTYDVINPYVISIKRKNPLEEITTSDVLLFEVIFSEEVVGVSNAVFNSVAGANISVTEIESSIYNVSVSNVNVFGVVDLKINETNIIQDTAGNVLINSVFNFYKN